MEPITLYADIELDSPNYFVITPEGNYIKFPYPEYDDNHEPVDIIDNTSHKKYIVIFNE